jgi:dihydroorotate dehydrogenase
MYKRIIKPILFCFNPEKVHHFVFGGLKFIFKIPGAKFLWRKLYVVQDERLKTNLWGIDFPSPVGLAAGLDKNATLFEELSHCGFGFIEVGTVTPKAQDGNPKPRLFRLPKDSGLINRMGFNNEGIEKMVLRLKKKHNTIIGGNIGKNKLTPNDQAFEDYLICFEQLFPVVDYFVVNVSSPNTPNLRDLQEKEPLTDLLNHLMELNRKKDKPKPILLKIAPDLTEGQLLDIIDIVKITQINGVIATNTTIDRSNLLTPISEVEMMGNGGLSGKPLKNKSLEVVRFLAEKSNKSFPIIGVGGIFTPEDAIEMLEAGANLIQIYTSFIYEGPAIIKKINKKVLEMRKNTSFEKKNTSF